MTRFVLAVAFTAAAPSFALGGTIDLKVKVSREFAELSRFISGQQAHKGERRAPKPLPADPPGERRGAALAVDPLGRGTWVVDEEKDEVALVPVNGKEIQRVSAGAWPQQVVVESTGRAFVSARHAGEV